MKYILRTFIFLLSFCFSSLAFAQETQTITVGSDTVTYTEVFSEAESITSYYNGDTLVLSEYDIDGNDVSDMWVFFREDLTISKEVRDSNEDGIPDIFFEFDKEENITKTYGDGLKQYEVKATSNTSINAIDNATDDDGEVDYAGNLEDIQKLAGESAGWGAWVALIVILMGVFIWWKKK